MSAWEFQRRFAHAPAPSALCSFDLCNSKRRSDDMFIGSMRQVKHLNCISVHIYLHMRLFRFSFASPPGPCATLRLFLVTLRLFLVTLRLFLVTLRLFLVTLRTVLR